MQVSLRVREVAERQGLRLAQVQREARLSVTTARRYWYNSRSGLARDAGTLTEVNLETLGMIAALLKVQPGELLEACE
jgi:DNA-binding Xre family transcriptional regulator